MRKILFILGVVLLFSFIAGDRILTNRNEYGFVQGGLRVDSLLALPKDTAFRKDFWGADKPLIAAKNGTLFLFNPSTGVWGTITGGGGGTSFGLNSPFFLDNGNLSIPYASDLSDGIVSSQVYQSLATKAYVDDAIATATSGTDSIPVENTGTGMDLTYTDAGTLFVKRVLFNETLSIGSPSATTNRLLLYTPVDISITGIKESVQGGTFTCSIVYGSDRSTASTVVAASHAVSSTAGTSASLTNTVVPGGSYIVVSGSAISGTPTEATFTISYKQ